MPAVRSSLAARSAARRPKRRQSIVRAGVRPTEPRAAEGGYIAGLRKVWFACQSIIAAGLAPLLEVWPQKEEHDAADDVAINLGLRRWLAAAANLTPRPHGFPPIPATITAETIERQMGWIRVELGHWIRGNPDVVPLIRRAAGGVDRHVQDDLGRILRIDIRRDDPRVAGLIDGFRERNISLIESGVMAPFARPQLRPSLLADVSRTVEEAHASGLRVEELAGQLRERFDVSDSRAALIARDQVLKLNSEINQARQTAVGITHYRWSTSKDEAVRPMHRDLEGATIAWDDPPVTNEAGDTNHAGEDYQCRCIAIPLPPEAGSEADYGLQ